MFLKFDFFDFFVFEAKKCLLKHFLKRFFYKNGLLLGHNKVQRCASFIKQLVLDTLICQDDVTPLHF